MDWAAVYSRLYPSVAPDTFETREVGTLHLQPAGWRPNAFAHGLLSPRVVSRAPRQQSLPHMYRYSKGEEIYSTHAHVSLHGANSCMRGGSDTNDPPRTPSPRPTRNATTRPRTRATGTHYKTAHRSTHKIPNKGAGGRATRHSVHGSTDCSPGSSGADKRTHMQLQKLSANASVVPAGEVTDEQAATRQVSEGPCASRAPCWIMFAAHSCGASPPASPPWPSIESAALSGGGEPS